MRWLAIALLSVSAYGGDLVSIQQEPNLERRSQLAIDYANTALDDARKQYQEGDTGRAEAALKCIADGPQAFDATAGRAELEALLATAPA